MLHLGEAHERAGRRAERARARRRRGVASLALVLVMLDAASSACARVATTCCASAITSGMMLA